MFKKKQPIELEYSDLYFYMTYSWWSQTRDGNIRTCYRVAKADVPADYVRYWGQEPELVN